MIFLVPPKLSESRYHQHRSLRGCGRETYPQGYDYATRGIEGFYSFFFLRTGQMHHFSKVSRYVPQLLHACKHISCFHEDIGTEYDTRAKSSDGVPNFNTRVLFLSIWWSNPRQKCFRYIALMGTRQLMCLFLVLAQKILLPGVMHVN
jgi:hypothetical protein